VTFLATLRGLLFGGEEPRPKRKPVTHDLSNRYWGHNYEVLKAEGDHLHIAMWYTPPFKVDRELRVPMPGDYPDVGDFLLLQSKGSPDGKTRYRIATLEWCGNPRDMYFADLSFAPRTHAVPEHAQ
jgi:hypothetical protein